MNDLNALFIACMAMIRWGYYFTVQPASNPTKALGERLTQTRATWVRIQTVPVLNKTYTYSIMLTIITHSELSSLFMLRK